MVLAAAVSAFVLVAVPAAVFMAIWTAVTMWRILFPERPLPLVRNGAAERRAARARGEAVGVGFREIHEDLRAEARTKERALDRVGGRPTRIPEAWLEDLQRRRN
jgi:hypothetical protein